jgi:uncharacterized protein
VYEVGGLGEIVSCERLAMGRYDLALRGEARVRMIRELPTDTLYRVVLVEKLADVQPVTDLTPMVDRLRATCRTLLEILGRPANILDAVFGEGQTPGVIADRIAAGVIPGADVRQELLEMVDVDMRVNRLIIALDALVEQLKRQRG